MDNKYLNKTGLQALNNYIANIYSKLNENISSVKERIEPLEYYVGQWVDGDESPDAVNFIGNEAVVDAWRPALVDCTDNDGDTTTLYELNRLNWLRYKDGFFAPAICVTEDEWNECEVALYFEDGTQYCDAGEFDAESFYNEYGYYTSLYDSDGNQISHIRRPWETTETKYSHVIANKVPLWLLDQQVSEENPTYVNKGIFVFGEEYDGFNFSGYKLPVTGIFASPFTTVDGQARSFFFDYCTGEENCIGGTGYGNCCKLFYNNGTYPRVNDVSQLTTVTYSRANNSDISLSYPFAEAGDFAHNVFCTCVELMAGTKYLHNNYRFGSGLSSNNYCTSENEWLLHGGLRYKTTDSDTYSYCTFMDTPEIYYDSSGSQQIGTYLLSSQYPFAQCEEGQTAFSLMQELGIAEDEEFEWNNGTWWWQSMNISPTVSDGHMNCRVYKKMEDIISAYNADGDSQDYNIGVILRFSLYEGLNICGDILSYYGGGMEMLGYLDQDEEVHYNIYIEPDQTKWHSETAISKEFDDNFELDELFDFQSSYKKLSYDLVPSNGWTWADYRYSYSPYLRLSGVEYSYKNECACINSKLAFTMENYILYRIAVRHRGMSSVSKCSARTLSSTFTVSRSYMDNSGTSQVLGTWK